jgi:hypothetical protein
MTTQIEENITVTGWDEVEINIDDLIQELKDIQYKLDVFNGEKLVTLKIERGIIHVDVRIKPVKTVEFIQIDTKINKKDDTSKILAKTENYDEEDEQKSWSEVEETPSLDVQEKLDKKVYDNVQSCIKSEADNHPRYDAAKAAWRELKELCAKKDNSINAALIDELDEMIIEQNQIYDGENYIVAVESKQGDVWELIK